MDRRPPAAGRYVAELRLAFFFFPVALLPPPPPLLLLLLLLLLAGPIFSSSVPLLLATLSAFSSSLPIDDASMRLLLPDGRRNRNFAEWARAAADDPAATPATWPRRSALRSRRLKTTIPSVSVVAMVRDAVGDDGGGAVVVVFLAGVGLVAGEAAVGAAGAVGPLFALSLFIAENRTKVGTGCGAAPTGG